ncbi:MAG: hypothetical protein D6679_03435 [Candidatus Hydrogenedentota bacterium]|nr:MAG: hypothetical protein D6679_03435 [Candidatus Hydrogenedentota bacterium]
MSFSSVRVAAWCLVILLGALYLSAPVRGAGEWDRLRAEQKRRSAAAVEAEKTLKKIEAELRVLSGKRRTTERRLRLARLKLQRDTERLKLQQNLVHEAELRIEEWKNHVKEMETEEAFYRKRLRFQADFLMRTALRFRMKHSDSSEEFQAQTRVVFSRHLIRSTLRLYETASDSHSFFERKRREEEALRDDLRKEEEKAAAAREEVRRRQKSLERLMKGLERETRKKKAVREKTKRMLRKIRAELAKIQKRLKELEKLFRKPGHFAKPVPGTFFRPEDVSVPGVFIRCPYGSPVKAGAPGEVLAIEEMRGLGRTVILGHGGGFSSVYSNLSKVTVKKGQKVRLGTVLGKSGKGAYGEMLYFAVYEKGKVRDPMTMVR